MPIAATGSTEYYEYVIFEQVNQIVGPAIWIGYRDIAYENYDKRHIKIDFPNTFTSKYMRVLLIDAHRRADFSIDVDYVVPGGFLLKN